MSCLVKTTTPFISKEILLEALEKCGYKYKIENGKIYIVHSDMEEEINKKGFIPVKISKNGKLYYEKITNVEDLAYIFIWEAYFEFVSGKYILNHDSWNNDISSFLIKVEKSYNNVYEIKLKEEAERLERERLAYIESQKKAIMEKAKAKGYRVVETKKDNKIQLTLVREVR
ncbi:hypothetical protein [Brachyspira catarrhinii]|uniref:Uncharacterized protein n=1 Tax=Brachyspira catarrhinii TaxID=2528966 RepID=A0ABY2TSD6_9SPIR|nr:hypothetical protein [Brachyspira catarrhinii]TKZ35679.1 hypothetical protein EZH24_03980 [Brachyspira catarrhinii]